MKTKLMAMLLMASGALFAGTHFAVGVQVGGPAVYAPAPAPVVVGAYRPPCPGPGYIWINGYYDGYGNWIGGYWALPPYAGAYWVAPRYYGGHFYTGYWGGARPVYRDYHYESHAPAWHGNEFRGHGGGHGYEGRGAGFANGYRR